MDFLTIVKTIGAWVLANWQTITLTSALTMFIGLLVNTFTPNAWLEDRGARHGLWISQKANRSKWLGKIWEKIEDHLFGGFIAYARGLLKGANKDDVTTETDESEDSE